MGSMLPLELCYLSHLRGKWDVCLSEVKTNKQKKKSKVKVDDQPMSVETLGLSWF